MFDKFESGPIVDRVVESHQQEVQRQGACEQCFSESRKQGSVPLNATTSVACFQWDAANKNLPLAEVLYGFGLNIVPAERIITCSRITPLSIWSFCDRRHEPQSIPMVCASVFILHFGWSMRSVPDSCRFDGATIGTASGARAGNPDRLYVEERIRARRRDTRTVATESNHIF
jgi:hypothetical protein